MLVLGSPDLLLGRFRAQLSASVASPTRSATRPWADAGIALAPCPTSPPSTTYSGRARRGDPDAGALPRRRGARGRAAAWPVRAGVSSRRSPSTSPPEAARWLARGRRGGVRRVAGPAPYAGPRQRHRPGACRAERVPEVLARFDGATTAKVKVAERGQSRAGRRRPRRCRPRRRWDPVRIRVDANGGWSVDGRHGRAAALAATAWSTPSSPARAWRSSPTCAWPSPGTASTSSWRLTSRSARRRTRSGWPGWRPRTSWSSRSPPLGGVARALEVVEACGLPAVVSSALDTSVGMAAGVALAAALPDLPYACGLGTVALLEGDVAAHRSCPRRCVLPWARGRQEALLDRWAAPPDASSGASERLPRRGSPVRPAPAIRFVPVNIIFVEPCVPGEPASVRRRARLVGRERRSASASPTRATSATSSAARCGGYYRVGSVTERATR